MTLWVGSRKVEQRGHHSLVYVTSIHGGDQFIGCLVMIPIRVPAKVSVKIDHKLAGHSVAIVLIVQYTRIGKGDLALRQLGPDKHLGNNDGSLDRTDDRYRQSPTHFPNDSQTTIAYGEDFPRTHIGMLKHRPLCKSRPYRLQQFTPPLVDLSSVDD
jgi:hypothetical protein